jgi:hypothetical protein
MANTLEVDSGRALQPSSFSLTSSAQAHDHGKPRSLIRLCKRLARKITTFKQDF